MNLNREYDDIDNTVHNQKYRNNHNIKQILFDNYADSATRQQKSDGTQ